MRLMQGLFYSAGVVSCVVTALYCKRISKQLDSIIKQDDDACTDIYMDGNGNIVDVGMYNNNTEDNMDNWVYL